MSIEFTPVGRHTIAHQESVLKAKHAPDLSAAGRAKEAKSDAAMKDGSYPITDAGSLADAAKDYYRTGKDPAVAAHIASRAKALGLANPLAG